MSVDKMQSMIEAALLKFLGNGGAAAVATPPAKPAEKPAKGKGKRKGNPEALAKWRAEQQAAKVEGGEVAVTKPKTKADKPAKEAKEKAEWTVKKHTTKQGKKGVIVTVGPFSCWVPEGDTDREQAMLYAVNKVFRTEKIKAAMDAYAVAAAE